MDFAARVARETRREICIRRPRKTGDSRQAPVRPSHFEDLTGKVSFLSGVGDQPQVAGLPKLRRRAHHPRSHRGNSVHLRHDRRAARRRPDPRKFPRQPRAARARHRSISQVRKVDASAEIRFARPAEPCLRAGDGAVRSTAAGRDYRVSNPRQILLRLFERSSANAPRRSSPCRVCSTGFTRESSATRKRHAGKVARKGPRIRKRPEISPPRLEISPHPSSLWLEILGVHLRRRCADARNRRIFPPHRLRRCAGLWHDRNRLADQPQSSVSCGTGFDRQSFARTRVPSRGQTAKFSCAAKM